MDDASRLKTYIENAAHRYQHSRSIYRYQPLMCVFGFDDCMYYLSARHKDKFIYFRLFNITTHTKLDFSVLDDMVNYIIGETGWYLKLK